MTVYSLNGMEQALITCDSYLLFSLAESLRLMICSFNNSSGEKLFFTLKESINGIAGIYKPLSKSCVTKSAEIKKALERV